MNEEKVPRALVEGYMEAAKLLGISLEDLEEGLLDLAGRFRGCIRCIHSRAPGNPSWILKGRGRRLDLVSRKCVLGLNQTDCGTYKPFL